MYVCVVVYFEWLWRFIIKDYLKLYKAIYYECQHTLYCLLPQVKRFISLSYEYKGIDVGNISIWLLCESNCNLVTNLFMVWLGRIYINLCKYYKSIHMIIIAFEDMIITWAVDKYSFFKFLFCYFSLFLFIAEVKPIYIPIFESNGTGNPLFLIILINDIALTMGM